jgi:hypothetical protein
MGRMWLWRMDGMWVEEVGVLNIYREYVCSGQRFKYDKTTSFIKQNHKVHVGSIHRPRTTTRGCVGETGWPHCLGIFGISLLTVSVILSI